MNVKAQGLLNAARFIEEHHGRDMLGEIVRACSPSVRDRYVSAIAINWHPMEELCEFVEVAERCIGSPPGKLGEQIGAAGARANMKGVLLRIAFYVTNPEFMMKRIAGLWSQFNDRGSMLLLVIGKDMVRLEVTGVPHPNSTFCSILTGWCNEVAVAIGVDGPVARHIECRALHAKRCIWEVRGSFLERMGKNDRPKV